MKASDCTVASRSVLGTTDPNRADGSTGQSETWRRWSTNADVWVMKSGLGDARPTTRPRAAEKAAAAAAGAAGRLTREETRRRSRLADMTTISFTTRID